jgi:formyltetrahydrofolate deformylase
VYYRAEAGSGPRPWAGTLKPVSEHESTPKAEFVLTLSCADRPGIVHAVTGALLEADCNITDSQQYGSPATGTFFMRVAVETPTTFTLLHAQLTPVAQAFGMNWELHRSGAPVRTLILASKAAHCLNDLLFLHRSGTLPIEIPAIVSNHLDLKDLADFYQIPFHHIPVTAETKADAEDALRLLIAAHEVELVVLARYMQVLSDELCAELTGKAINIHHSFLPSFKGARPYHQAHARGVKIIGATAHYVTGALDEGPIIEQEVIRVDHGRSAEQLVAMGRDVEGRTLATAVQWHAEHRVLLDGNRTVVFN